MRRILERLKLYLSLIICRKIRADAAIIDAPYIRFYVEDRLIFEIELC